MATREVLIVGATGQQGRATIAALHASAPHDPPLRILALTRSVASPKSQSLLTTYQNITLVEGDTKNPDPIFQAHPNISSVFLVTVPSDEEEQARPLIDAAVAPGRQVDHIVFSSVDRGGDQVSWERPTDVPHFATKHRIEQHLREACEETSKRWTILRPTGFMDNYTPNIFGKLIATLWEAGMPADRKMQLISTHDIGVFAAKALSHPDKWAGRAVGLAGDDLSFSDVKDIFKRTVGEDLPTTYSLLSRPVLWWVEEARRSFEWFSTVGYGADIEALRREEPSLQTFEEWLRVSSQWMSKCK
ncbi:Fc.00g061870.m01.CDS01 [Cosmosporella sp. VM-42]